MTLAKMRNHFPDAPQGFDHGAAEVVYGIISKLDDDTAEVLADMLVGEIHQRALSTHESEIRKSIGDLLDRHGARLRSDLTRAYISKRQSGEPVGDLMLAAELISKDWEGPAFTPQARAERAKKQHRDLTTGKFVTTHHDVGYTKIDANGRHMKAAHDAEAERHGIPKPDGKNLSDAQKLAYQQAYSQVAAITAGHRRNTAGKFLHLHYAGDAEPEVHPLPQGDAKLPIDPSRHLHSASVSVIPGHDDLDSYDTLGAVRSAVGQNYGIGHDSRGNNAGVQRIRDLNSGLHPGEHGAPGSAAMTRLGASSKFLDDSFRNEDGKSVLPRRAQAALKAGQVVGVYGPEAANVLGPAADKAAYRYRGTERAPDRSLLLAQEALRRNPNFKTPEERREVAIHGVETDAGWRPSSVLNYFHDKLPNQNLNALQRGSGVVPPSQGAIFDKDGKIVTQAVGYGDDHYLPFNLGKLHGLKGGEYVRTRSFGGPTTEDIYTGLVRGAKAMSVVSHNGVYTVEFDQGFTGKRRYNDKAQRMVARYGYLLDAVKNGRITTAAMDPSREQEIHDTATASYDPDTEPEEYSNEVNRLMLRESRNPTLSKQQKQAAAAEFLDKQAENHRTPDGHEMTRTELVDSWLDGQSRGDTDFKRDIATRSGLTSADHGNFNDAAIRAMGLSDKYSQFLQRKQEDYKHSLKPLALNGPGYSMALEALQEQFPYYIKSVDYHPWREAATNTDSGYVRPKANRPAEALSGYYDSDITGHGKVHANTTRGQARQVRDYTAPGQKIVERAKQTAGAAGGRKVSPDSARELRMQGDAAMAAEIRKHQNFGGQFHGGGKAELSQAHEFQNQPVSTLGDAELNRIHPSYAEVHKMGDDDVRRAQSTPEGADALHEKLKGVVAAIERHKVHDLDPKVKKHFASEGRPEGEKKFDKNAIGHHLRDPDAEHDFPGRQYRKGSGATQDEIEDTMSALTGDPKGMMPHRGQLAEDHKNLMGRHEAHVRWDTGPNRSSLNRPEGSATLDRDVEHHLKQRQLLRRWEEAAPEEEPGDEPGGIGFTGGATHQITLNLNSGGQLERIDPQVSSQDNGFLNQYGITSL